MTQRTCWALLAAAAAVLSPLPGAAQDDHACRAPELKPADFQKLHSMIRRQPGEQKYLDIEWVLDPWEARKKAVAEGKPILVFSHVGDALSHI